MNLNFSEEKFRQAAEAEDGMPISAGARVMHVRKSIDAGKAVYVDLSQVPEDKRPSLVAKINELVNQASTSI